jgi:hypothetical protein
MSGAEGSHERGYKTLQFLTIISIKLKEGN